jgi:hypothetical protein
MLITTKGGDRVEDEKEMQGKEAKTSEKVVGTCGTLDRGVNVVLPREAHVNKAESCYWHSSGDAEWQIKVNDWASARYGADWHDKHTPQDIESSLFAQAKL